MVANFVIGKEPKQPTIAAFNGSLPALGAKGNEERLKRVIHETIRPKPVENKPLPADVQRLLAWSEPVGGLAARIEAGGIYCAVVRLKNTSQRPLVVPTGNPRDQKAAQPFEVYVRQGAGPWRRAAWADDLYCAPATPDKDQSSTHRWGDTEGPLADRPLVTLRPGEHCLACVYAEEDKQDNGQPKEFKIVLRRPATGGPGQWTGVLETPPRPESLTLAQSEALVGASPMPEHFPSLTNAFPSLTNACIGSNWSGQASTVDILCFSNRELFELLAYYDPPGVRKEFERRMRAEKRLPVKLFLAVPAARAGSEEAALFLLKTMKDSDYRTRINVNDALEQLFGLFSYPCGQPPAWVVELSMAVLADDRLVTGLNAAGGGNGTSFTVATYGVDGLERGLCESGCRQAVPLLIQRLKKGLSGSDTAVLLGEMGDKRAIPCLIDLADAAGKAAGRQTGPGTADELSRLAYALAKLKAREAVPLLLRYIEFPEIIDDLGEIGDPRVVPVLEKLVSTRGKFIREGKDVYPDLAQERFYNARVALAGFDKENGAVRLGEMLGDNSFTAFQRAEVAIRLGHRQDAKAIPYLVKAVKTESSYPPDEKNEFRSYLIGMAIDSLGQFKYKAAVEGLIECFDADFKKHYEGKGEYETPESYRNRIARSLQQITGETFGADKQQWLKWWREKGKQSAELK